MKGRERKYVGCDYRFWITDNILLALFQVYQCSVFCIVVAVCKTTMCYFFCNAGCGILFYDSIVTCWKRLFQSCMGIVDIT